MKSIVFIRAVSLALSLNVVSGSARSFDIECADHLITNMIPLHRNTAFTDGREATVKVWAGNEHVGTATLVSAKPVLLITAHHIFEDMDGRPLTIEYPVLNKGIYHKAQIVEFVEAGREIHSLTGDDVAVLHAGTPPPGVSGIDLTTRGIQLGGGGYAFGTGGGRPGASGEETSVNYTQGCRSGYDAKTVRKDSGGGFFSSDGLLAGVIVQDDGKGGRYAPVACILSTILRAAQSITGMALPGILPPVDGTMPTLAAALAVRPNSLTLALKRPTHRLSEEQLSNLTLERFVAALPKKAVSMSEWRLLAVTQDEYCHLEEAVLERLGKRSTRIFFARKEDGLRLVVSALNTPERQPTPLPVLAPDPDIDVVMPEDEDAGRIPSGDDARQPASAVDGWLGMEGDRGATLYANDPRPIPANTLTVVAKPVDPEDPLLDPGLPAKRQYIIGSRLFEAFGRLYRKQVIDPAEWREELDVVHLHLEKAEELYSLDHPFDPDRELNLRLLDEVHLAALTLSIVTNDRELRQRTLIRRQEILAQIGPGLLDRMGVGKPVVEAALSVSEFVVTPVEQARRLLAQHNRDILSELPGLRWTGLALETTDNVDAIEESALVTLSPSMVTPLESSGGSSFPTFTVSPALPTGQGDPNIELESFKKRGLALRYRDRKLSEGNPVYLETRSDGSPNPYRVMQIVEGFAPMGSE